MDPLASTQMFTSGTGTSKLPRNVQMLPTIDSAMFPSGQILVWSALRQGADRICRSSNPYLNREQPP